MNLALLIDGENIPANLLTDINRKVALLGEPIVKCVFGDFSENRLSGWISAARDHGLELAFQVSEGRHKNSADVALTIRAMELLYSGLIDGFCLTSSDRDFAPLAAKLRQHGKKVYGFGEAKANDAFRANFTQFFLLGAQSGVSDLGTSTANSAPKASDHTDHPIIEFLRHLNGTDPAGFIPLSVVASTMRREAPDLAARIAGKGKFLKTLRQTGQIEQSGTTGDVRIRLRRAYGN